MVSSPPVGMVNVLHETISDAGTRGRERRAADRAAIYEVPNHQTIADLLKRLGGVSAARVRLQPSPGTATEATSSRCTTARTACSSWSTGHSSRR